MIVCGVEIKGQEAILAVAERDDEHNILHLNCATKRLALGDERDVQSLLAMQQAIKAFANQNNIDSFVVKARQSRGQLAAGGVTFKIEALFQLSGTPVGFVSAPALAAFAKKNMGGVPSTVKAYQTDSFRAAALHISKL